MIDKLAGLATQIRDLERRLKEIDTKKVNPTKVKEITDTIKNLKDMLAEKKKKKEERKKKKEEASKPAEVEAAVIPTEVVKESAPTPTEEVVKEADVNKFAIDSKVEPIRGTPGNWGVVIREAGVNNDPLCYVKWMDGNLKTAHGDYGAYYPSDLKLKAEVVAEAKDPTAYVPREQLYNLEADLKSNYERMIADMQEEIKMAQEKGEYAWVGRLEEKLADIQKSYDEKYNNEKHGEDENGSGGTNKLKVYDMNPAYDKDPQEKSTGYGGDRPYGAMTSPNGEENSLPLESNLKEAHEHFRCSDTSGTEHAGPIVKHMHGGSYTNYCEKHLPSHIKYNTPEPKQASLKLADMDLNSIDKRYAIYLKDVSYPAARTLTYAKAQRMAKEKFPEQLAAGKVEIKREDFKEASLEKQALDTKWLPEQGRKAGYYVRVETTQNDLAGTGSRTIDGLWAYTDKLVGQNATNSDQQQHGLPEGDYWYKVDYFVPTMEEAQLVAQKLLQIPNLKVTIVKELGVEKEKFLTQPLTSSLNKQAINITVGEKLFIVNPLQKTADNEYQYDVTIGANNQKLFKITSKDEMGQEHLSYVIEKELTKEAAVEHNHDPKVIEYMYDCPKCVSEGKAKKKSSLAKLTSNLAFLKKNSLVSILSEDKVKGQVKFASLDGSLRGWAPSQKFSAMDVPEAKLIDHEGHKDEILGESGSELLVTCPANSNNVIWREITAPPATPESLNDMESAKKCDICKGTGRRKDIPHTQHDEQCNHCKGTGKIAAKECEFCAGYGKARTKGGVLETCPYCKGNGTKQDKTSAKECSDCHGNFVGAEGDKCPSCGRFAVKADRKTPHTKECNDANDKSPKEMCICDEKTEKKASAFEKSQYVKENIKPLEIGDWLVIDEQKEVWANFGKDREAIWDWCRKMGIGDTATFYGNGFKLVQFEGLQTGHKESSLTVESHIRHEDGKWIVYNHDYTKTLGSYPTKEEALKRLRQIEFYKRQGSLLQPLSKKEAKQVTKCVKPGCDKEQEPKDMIENVHGAGYLCKEHAKAWNKDTKTLEEWKKLQSNKKADQNLEQQIQGFKDRMSAVTERLANPPVKQASELDETPKGEDAITTSELIESLERGIDLLEGKTSDQLSPEEHHNLEEMENLLWKVEDSLGLSHPLPEHEMKEPEHAQEAEVREEEFKAPEALVEKEADAINNPPATPAPAGSVWLWDGVRNSWYLAVDPNMAGSTGTGGTY